MAGEFCDFAQVGGQDGVSRFAAELSFVLKFLSEQFA